MPLRLDMDEVWELLEMIIRQEYGDTVGGGSQKMFFVVTNDNIHELVVGTADEDFSEVEKFADQLIAEQAKRMVASSSTAQVLGAVKNAILLEVSHRTNPDRDYQKVVNALARMDQTLAEVPEDTPMRKELAAVVRAVKRIGDIA